MKSQVTNESKNSGAKKSMNGSVALLAIFRLALLVGPETIVFKTLLHSPVICVLAAVTVLGVWLSVDVWPFKVAGPAMAKAPVAKKVTAFSGNMTTSQRVHFLVCQAMVVVAMLHSKLTV